MWVITASINAYEQEGDYLVAVYKSKPTFKQLKTLLKEDDVTIGKLTRGGGRQNYEGSWYHLSELKEGKKYEAID